MAGSRLLNRWMTLERACETVTYRHVQVSVWLKPKYDQFGR